MTTRFAVSDVVPGAARLPERTLEASWAARGLRAPEAWGVSRPGALVACEPHHGLLMAVHLAYAHHLPLILTPDDIWLCVAQGVGQHVHANVEALRGELVGHGGQLELEVRRDAFLPGSPDNDWPSVFTEFVDRIGAHLAGRRELFECVFSTTGHVERCVTAVAMMAGLRKCFSYSVSTLCGIPEVVLEGTPADWRLLRERVAELEGLKLKWWTRPLGRVLKQLVEAIKKLHVACLSSTSHPSSLSRRRSRLTALVLSSRSKWLGPRSRKAVQSRSMW